MLVFACLICKTPFRETKVFDGERSPTSPSFISKSHETNVVLTQCGHYFHLNCIEGAFIYDKIRTESLDLPSRKLCPFSECGRDLSQTALTKINPVRVKALDPESEVMAQLEDMKSDLLASKRKVLELTREIKELKNRLVISKASFVPGDKVVYTTSNSTEELYGTVLKVRVEIEPDITNSNNNNNRTSANNPTWRESASKLMHQISLQSNTITLPAEQVEMADPMRVTRQFATEEYSDLKAGIRPKWAAGDRVYLPSEKESATIKWIGSRQYKFIVVIEYDQPVGDNSLDLEDLPFLIKPGHGRKLTMDELNDCAQKESKSPTAILNTLFRWGTKRGRLPKRTSTFYTNGNANNENDNL